MASADSATVAEERCGFCWFHHYGLGRIWLRRRLQLGGWLSSFLVAVGAGHGSAEVVLLAAGIFRGRPVWGSGVASLLLSGGRAGCGFWFWMFIRRGWAEGEMGWVESRFLGLCWQRVKACKWCSQWLQAGEVRSGEGRREACVQRESLLRKGEEQWRQLWRGRAAPAASWLGKKTVSLCSAEKGRSCVWELREEKKIAGGKTANPKKTTGERGRWLGFGWRKN